MTDLTREEIDAKLEANEARRDAMFATINGKLDLIVERLESQIKRIDKLEQAMISLKSTVIITGISSSIAIILGVAGFNATLLSNMTATFESGKETATMQYETRRMAQETNALLKKWKSGSINKLRTIKSLPLLNFTMSCYCRKNCEVLTCKPSTGRRDRIPKHRR